MTYLCLGFIFHFWPVDLTYTQYQVTCDIAIPWIREVDA